jgi:hypothetical protein
MKIEMLFGRNCTKKESIASICVSIYNIDWYDFSCMDQKVKQIQA